MIKVLKQRWVTRGYSGILYNKYKAIKAHIIAAIGWGFLFTYASVIFFFVQYLLDKLI